MAVSKTYYYQGVPILAPISFQSNRPVQISESFSLKLLKTTFGAQRYELDFRVKMSGRSREAVNFLRDAIVSDVSISEMEMPQMPGLDSPTHTDYIKLRPTSVGSETINVNNESRTGTSILLQKGTFVRLSNHSKIYILTSDLLQNSTTVGIFPKLRVALLSSHTMLHPGSAVKPNLVFHRSRDTLSGVQFSDGQLIDPGSIRLVEAV